MKRRAFVIDDDDEDRRFVVNAISEPTSCMHDDIDVPIICLDDEDDDNDNGAGDLKIDKGYKVYLDDLSRDDGNLGPFFEVDNGESDIRKFDNSRVVDRVYQERKRKTVGIKDEISRALTLADIQRDNRAAERRKRRFVEFETTKTSRAVPLRKPQQRDNRVGRCIEVKTETLSSDVPLVRTQEDIQGDNRAAEQKKLRVVELEATRTSRAVPFLETRERDKRAENVLELKAETLRRAVPPVRTKEDSERDNIAAEQRKQKIVELEAPRTSRAVPLVETRERDNRAGEVLELKAQTLSRVVPLVRTQEDIQGDNRAAEQRKRRVVELEATRTSRAVPLLETRERDSRTGEDLELKAQTLSRVVPLVRTEEDIERDNIAAEQRKRKIVELEATRTSRAVPFLETQKRDNRAGDVLELKAPTLSRAVPLTRTEEDIERVNIAAEQRKRKIVELEATRTSRAVPLLKTRERDSRAGDVLELKAHTLSRAVPLTRTEEDIERVNIAAEQKKRRIVELEATRTSRAVPLSETRERDNRAGKVELKAETLRRVFPLVRNQRDNIAAERKKRKISEPKVAETCSVVHVERVDGARGNVDRDYMNYLKWLVDSLKDSIIKPMVNLPIPDNLKESSVVPEKDPLVEVKVEPDVESWSSDSDIIAVSDSPFLDGEDTPFVMSKKVIDLDAGSKEVESSSRCWFKKELMDVMKKPYNEGELKRLHHEASIHKRIIRSREFRKGRETVYETNELGKSYLEKFTDFENAYKAVDGVDKARALKLLRGFFFYLKNVSHDGAFKPWVKNQWWQP